MLNKYEISADSNTYIPTFWNRKYLKKIKIQAF
jgi:hypothetical protein